MQNRARPQSETECLYDQPNAALFFEKRTGFVSRRAFLRPSARRSFAQAKLSSSQQPTNPVPPVTNKRCASHFFPEVPRMIENMVEVRVGLPVRGQWIAVHAHFLRPAKILDDFDDVIEHFARQPGISADEHDFVHDFVRALHFADDAEGSGPVLLQVAP